MSVAEKKNVRILQASLILAAEGVGRLSLVVFHRGHVAGVRLMSKGFQPTPFRCPKCKRKVVSDDELRYKHRLELKVKDGPGWQTR